MRILAISDAPDRPETALFLGLQQKGYDITVVSSISDDSELSRTLKQAKIEHLHHKISSRISLRTIRYLRSLTDKFDIVHCFSARALSNAVIGLSSKRIKIVAYRGTVGHLSRLDPSAWLSFLNSKVSAISCVSDAVKIYLLKQGVPKQKLFTIYKGHREDWYNSFASISLEKEPGIQSSAPVVSFVGNMRPVKGADLLIEAFTALNHKSAHLVLVGDVRDSAIKNAVNKSSLAARIHLLGPRKDAPAFVRASDIFVMPSREREGLPKAVIEAMLLKRAIIISDAGGMPEMIKDGESGLIVPANDVPALRDALARIIDDSELRRRLGEAAYQRALKQFDVSQTVALTDAMYRSLMERY